MIALALAEWRLWKGYYLRASLPIALIFLFAASIPTQFRLILLCTTVGLLSILLGWRCGDEWKPGSPLRDLAVGMSPSEILAGRLLAALAVWAFHLLVALPPLLFAVAILGLPAGVLAVWAFLWLASFALAMGLGFLSSLVLGRTDHFVGGYVLAAWFLPGLFLRPALAINPLVQAWSVARGSGPGAAFLCATLEFALAVLAFLVVGRLLARNGKREDGQAAG